MVDKIKVLNFLQDFGCARLDQSQILYDDNTYNFNNILSSNKEDKLILAFIDKEELDNISCELEYIYCVYPGLEILN